MRQLSDPVTLPPLSSNREGTKVSAELILSCTCQSGVNYVERLGV
jgi:hypothetical protein